MTITLSLFIGLCAAILLLPLASDAISLAKLIRRTGTSSDRSSNQRLLFLVPAHNEESMIGRCVDSLLAQEYPREMFDVLVIADNCTDGTARAAREHGADCLERVDPVNRGKPHAIAHTLSVRDYEAYDAVVIVDADAVVDAGFARGMSRVPDLRNTAAQAYNDISNPRENALTRMAELFGAARYDFAFPLKERAGVNVPLGGNGMCLGTAVLNSFGWRAFSICEDFELYAQLTGAGYRTHLAPHARIYAHEATNLQQGASQRKRWSGGKMTVFLRYAGHLLASRRISLHQKLDIVGELASVGPAVHVGLTLLLGALAIGLHLPGAVGLAILLGLSLLRMAAYSALGLGRIQEPARAVLAFAYFPFYVLWRLGVQVSAMFMIGNRQWVRTGRPA